MNPGHDGWWSDLQDRIANWKFVRFGIHKNVWVVEHIIIGVGIAWLLKPFLPPLTVLAWDVGIMVFIEICQAGWDYLTQGSVAADYPAAEGLTKLERWWWDTLGDVLVPLFFAILVVYDLKWIIDLF